MALLNRRPGIPLRERPIVAAAIDKLKENRPLAAAIAEGVVAAAGRDDTKVVKADVPKVVEAVQQAMAENPVVRSQQSAEPWYQNRVKVGLYFIGAGALLKMISPDLGEWWEQNEELLTTVIMAFGGVVAAIGEWAAKWLAGIDWKRPWTILGIGRVASNS